MMDGLSVMEDVGGIYGFRDFLRTVSDDSPDIVEVVKEQKNLARMQEWIGRKFTPEKFLWLLLSCLLTRDYHQICKLNVLN
jgi:hypothetical protein